MASQNSNATLNKTALPALSRQERQVLGQLMLGGSETRIANALGVSRRQLCKSMTEIFRIFGARTRGELFNTCLNIMRNSIETSWPNNQQAEF